MEASRNLISVLMDERKRIDHFQSFWDRRIEVESNYIHELERLVFAVPGPAGSLKESLDALNALVRIEIEQRTVILNMLRDLRGDSSSPFGGWGSTSRTHWLDAVSGEVDKKILGLTRPKSDVTRCKELAERAVLSTEKEVFSQPSNVDKHQSHSISRLLLGKLRTQPSPTELKTLVNVPPNFVRFSDCDRRYRISVGRYNHLREHYIGESMQMADQLVMDEFKAIAMIQKMISSFADSQSDFASASNRGSTQCRFIADKIDSSTEGHNSLIRIRNGLSVTFGQPHLYKNFWFGADALRSPRMLFGYIPDSDSEVTTLTSAMRLFEVLIKHDPVLSLGPSDTDDFGNERLCKLAHDIETHWNPEEVDGGGEVVRLLTTYPEYQGLSLHFLWRTPRPLVKRQYLALDTPIGVTLAAFCEICNNCKSYSERKMLSMVLHLLVNSSKDETGVQWKWWDQHNRKESWYRALIHAIDEIILMLDINKFVLWAYCIDWEAGQLVFSWVEFERLYGSWKQWAHAQWALPNHLYPFPPM